MNTNIPIINFCAVGAIFGGFMNRCKDCKFRNEAGECTSSKISDSARWPGGYYDDEEEERENIEKTKDMLLYSYDEGGSFFVGEEFGCVHHER
jgi:hypothetical protein